jgi:hypothetical protein
LDASGSGGPTLSDIFVVPQRILMAPGNLADQITYPFSIPAPERTPQLVAHLQDLLDRVGIGYLVERWAGDAQDTVMTIDGVPITVVSVQGEDSKGWDATVTWEDVLSLGEQQRMVRCNYRLSAFMTQPPPIRYMRCSYASIRCCGGAGICKAAFPSTKVCTPGRMQFRRVSRRGRETVQDRSRRRDHVCDCLAAFDAT